VEILVWHVPLIAKFAQSEVPVILVIMDIINQELHVLHATVLKNALVYQLIP
jgi:hypothetical protein